MTAADRRAGRQRLRQQRYEEAARRLSLAMTTHVIRRYFDAAGAAPAHEVMARVRQWGQP